MKERTLSRRDVEFLLFDWLQVQHLAERERHADHSRETFSAALDTYQSIAAEQFAPLNKKGDQQEPAFEGNQVRVLDGIQPALAAFSGAGLMAARQDYNLNGMLLPVTVERAGMAMLMAANLAISGYAFLTIANAELLLAYGSQEQIERFVRPMLEGRFLGTMCLSEPQAGSSLADIRTRAELQDDGTYRLFGNKMWISGGDHELSENIVHLVLAKIPGPDGKLQPGVKGISLFLVPKYLVNVDGRFGDRNDVALAGLNHKMGYRALPNCMLNFGEGRCSPNGASGAVGYLIGEPGNGLSYMFKMMNEARIAVGLGAAALGYAGYLHALDYARTRTQGRLPSDKDPLTPMVPIIEHADVRRMLLAQKAYAEGALALCLYSARLLDEQITAQQTQARLEAEQLLDLLTPVTKSWPSQWCLAANDLAIQVHGGYGYTREYNVEQFYRDNRLNAIHEGTVGIQANDLLARKLRQHEGASLRLLDARIRTTIGTALGNSRLAEDANRLGEAWSQIIRVTEKLLSIDQTTLRLANAVPFLEAFGHVVLAWIWTEQALAAERLLAETADPSTRNFLLGKVQSCRYFHRWELPRLGAWLAVLDPVDTTCLDTQDAWF